VRFAVELEEYAERHDPVLEWDLSEAPEDESEAAADWVDAYEL